MVKASRRSRMEIFIREITITISQVVMVNIHGKQVRFTRVYFSMVFVMEKDFGSIMINHIKANTSMIQNRVKVYTYGKMEQLFIKDLLIKT